MNDIFSLQIKYVVHGLKSHDLHICFFFFLYSYRDLIYSFNQYVFSKITILYCGFLREYRLGSIIRYRLFKYVCIIQQSTIVLYDV